ncbi:23S rRNA (cytidine(2498)-2'-O)-methyltransferase RlmM [Neiella marina]|uniref:23S rRNA (Cytidine(2498)-2'-O)-methyltransferase RlmM n=1 Tax=Neiella holothuriorum TaxID=2870530 RepID=A0ABS7EHP4_9GAMM|nr:23S rRNA (cytidine(2498)-2'-O)-methyltransferase RlmM [Neiella holothuriorum]MBW8191845.1 23S rRNA (cytidine(2498)-2'-O)-methyltransferase RlmM [Neiella holothuriorum]
MKQIMLYCRAGFESETGAEFAALAEKYENWGYVRASKDSGFAIYETYQQEDADALSLVPIRSLIFARQLIFGDTINFEPEDRVGPILAQVAELGPFSELRIETLDTNDGKSLNRLAKKLNIPLTKGLEKQDKLNPKDNQLPVLHVCLIAGTQAFVGTSEPGRHSPYLNGIMRLRVPSAAPSRSTLKLDEALLSFFSEAELKARMTSGMKAIDLGACPGGWTYQLVRRGLFVTSVDNGSMAESLMETGQVKHYREDGFGFDPKRKPVAWIQRQFANGKRLRWPENAPSEWMVCDMADKPRRVVHMLLEWFQQGNTRNAIVNLKLPMKARWEEVQTCMNILRDELPTGMVIKAKHLYHDREEITVFVGYPKM